MALLLKHVEEATSLNLQDPTRNWPYLEASLYVWSAVAESLAEEEEECPILTQFLAKLPTLPYNNNMKVISSALDCIGGKRLKYIDKMTLKVVIKYNTIFIFIKSN